MSNLVLGSGSFLGNSFLKFLENRQEKVFGASSYHIENSDNILITDYSFEAIENIIYKIKPRFIFDFKSPIVSSDKESYANKTIEQFVEPTKNIVNCLKNIKSFNSHVTLISSNLLNNKKYSEHPYVKIKSEQERLYLGLNNKFLKKNILRIPAVIGIGDLNFNRLLPFIMGNYLLNKEIQLNSNKETVREYITIHQLFELLILRSETFEFSYSYTNNQIVDQISSILKEKGLEKLKLNWNNKVNNNEINKSQSMDVSFKNNLENVVEWYLENSDYVKKSFLNFNF